MFSVTEAAELTGLKDYQLRTYEEKLGIVIARNDQGHRIYDHEDINLFKEVKSLKGKGLTLEEIKMKLFPEKGEKEQQQNPMVQSVKLPEIQGEELLQLWKEQQQSFAKEFLEEMRVTIREEVAATIREDLKEELILEMRGELTRQEEQRDAENHKLMKAIQEIRDKQEEEKKKKFIFW